jgi:hypothetical protein
MNSYQILILLSALLANDGATMPTTPERRPSREWIDIPWNLRYVIFINSEKVMKIEMDTYRRFNAQDGKLGQNYVYLNVKELLPKIKKSVPSGKNPLIATAVIYFDPNGKTLNQEPPFSTFTAKRSGIDTLVLIKEGTDEKPYSIANWDQGIPGDVSFSPAVCVTTDRHRYSNQWKKTDSSGNVGCREWTAQLYQKEPYIDVTTYSKKGNFIGEVVGWARFEDGPTPIIGMQGKQWLCLHECPAGEQPGVIPDMQAWTRKHGFSMPVPPTKQPRYPNKDYEDDLNEFWSN